MNILKEALEIISVHKAQIKECTEFLFVNPETGWEEFKSVAVLTALLKNYGFNIESLVAGLPTAFKATSGKGGSQFCFIAEYDALPELGHACGHPLIAASALAAGIALKELLKNHSLQGTVIVMGTPGEEDKAGKVIMTERGAFNGIDAALISHPMDKSSTDSGCLSLSRYQVDFYGRSSHAALNPEDGINALDAMLMLFSAIGMWRQQLPEASRVHGVITKGGNAPNIIPDHTQGLFNVRAETESVKKQMEFRFESMVSAAASANECRSEIKILSVYKSSHYNATLNEAFFKSASLLGMKPVNKSSGGRISSDYGNVSQMIPAANLLFGITNGESIPLHTNEFRIYAASETAFEETMKTAAIMAEIAFHFISDPEFRDNVKTSFCSNPE